MFTSGLPLSPQVDSLSLYCPVGCADSHNALNTSAERELILNVLLNNKIAVEKFSRVLTYLLNNILLLL